MPINCSDVLIVRCLLGYRGFHPLALQDLNGLAESLHILGLFLCLDLRIIVRDLFSRLDIDLVGGLEEA